MTITSIVILVWLAVLTGLFAWKWVSNNIRIGLLAQVAAQYLRTMEDVEKVSKKPSTSKKSRPYVHTTEEFFQRKAR